MNLQNLNTLRAISIILIIIGHILLQYQIEGMGRYCCYLFVQIFFIISALLIGLKYNKTAIDITFLTKRWKRLSFSYYPFLFISIILLSLYGENVTFKNIITHFTYTNYVIQDTLNGVEFGHLWYISMIMVCYLSLYMFYNRHVYNTTKNIGGSARQIILYTAITLLLSIICLKIGIPSRIPIVIISYIIIFIKSQEIIKSIEQLPQKLLWFVFVLSNVVLVILFEWMNLNKNLLLRDILTFMTAYVWVLFFMKIKIKSNFIIYFISTISFELYLVHHPFILGKYSIFNNKYSFLDLATSLLIVSIIITVLAYFLHYIGNIIRKRA